MLYESAANVNEVALALCALREGGWTNSSITEVANGEKLYMGDVDIRSNNETIGVDKSFVEDGMNEEALISEATTQLSNMAHTIIADSNNHEDSVMTRSKKHAYMQSHPQVEKDIAYRYEDVVIENIPPLIKLAPILPSIPPDANVESVEGMSAATYQTILEEQQSCMVWKQPTTLSEEEINHFIQRIKQRWASPSLSPGDFVIATVECEEDDEVMIQKQKLCCVLPNNTNNVIDSTTTSSTVKSTSRTITKGVLEMNTTNSSLTTVLLYDGQQEFTIDPSSELLEFPASLHEDQILEALYRNHYDTEQVYKTFIPVWDMKYKVLVDPATRWTVQEVYDFCNSYKKYGERLHLIYKHKFVDSRWSLQDLHEFFRFFFGGNLKADSKKARVDALRKLFRKSQDIRDAKLPPLSDEPISQTIDETPVVEEKVQEESAQPEQVEVAEVAVAPNEVTIVPTEVEVTAVPTAKVPRSRKRSVDMLLGDQTIIEDVIMVGRGAIQPTPYTATEPRRSIRAFLASPPVSPAPVVAPASTRKRKPRMSKTDTESTNISVEAIQPQRRGKLTVATGKKPSQVRTKRRSCITVEEEEEEEEEQEQNAEEEEEDDDDDKSEDAEDDEEDNENEDDDDDDKEEEEEEDDDDEDDDDEEEEVRDRRRWARDRLERRKFREFHHYIFIMNPKVEPLGELTGSERRCLVYNVSAIKGHPHVKSENLSIKGVTQLRGGKFKLQLRLGAIGKKQLSKNIDHLMDALLYYELMYLIVDKPTSLEALCQLGNYDELTHLTGKFRMFTTPIEYYLMLGRFLCKLHQEAEYGKLDENLDDMIKVFNNLKVVSGNASKISRFLSNTEISRYLVNSGGNKKGGTSSTGDKSKSPSYPLNVTDKVYKTMVSLFTANTSLTESRQNIIDLFSNYPFVNDYPRMGVCTLLAKRWSGQGRRKKNYQNLNNQRR